MNKFRLQEVKDLNESIIANEDLYEDLADELYSRLQDLRIDELKALETLINEYLQQHTSETNYNINEALTVITVARQQEEKARFNRNQLT